MFNTSYNKKTPFRFENVKEYLINRNIEFGLADDNLERNQNLLKKYDTSLILSPHDGDVIILEKNTSLILEAREKMRWHINDVFFQDEVKAIFTPNAKGEYRIRAQTQNENSETITIYLQ